MEVILSPEERWAPEALAGLRKSEARLRERAGIVLRASASPASAALPRNTGQSTHSERISQPAKCRLKR
jgi:hypothetical protein